MGTEPQLPLDGKTGRTPPPPKPSRDIAPPTPTEQRRMLVNGAADFNKNHPPGPGEPQTGEEQVDEALARGVVRLQTQDALLDQHEMDEAEAAAALARGEITHIITTTSDPFDVQVTEVPRAAGVHPYRDMVLCPAQDQIAVTFNDDGDLTITQRSALGESEDQAIQVAAANIGSFIDLLTDALGIPSCP